MGVFEKFRLSQNPSSRLEIGHEFLSFEVVIYIIFRFLIKSKIENYYENNNCAVSNSYYIFTN